MFTLEDLLNRGYFPKELPPAFVTESFTSAIINNSGALPPELKPTSNRPAGSLCHSVARLGITRRNMNIPNPIPFLRLCREIVCHERELTTFFQKSKLSKSKPINNTGFGRALISSSNFDELLLFRSRIRSTSKFILRADITKFYPSIYTHSISWALHTKPIAKANRNNQHLLGNILDKCVRNCQDTQSIGIPIGPDSSLVISEIILTAVDEILCQRHPDITGIRYVDDYEFGFKSYAAAEEILASLQEALQTFELSLNYSKTKILDLPIPLDPVWLAELRQFYFRITPRSQQSDLIHYFSKALEYSIQYPEDFVLRYALARLRGVIIDKDNWEVTQDFMFQCLMVDPSTFLVVLERLMAAHQDGYTIDRNKIDIVMNYQITQSCPTGKTSEVAWALWALIFWSVPISQYAADAVSKVEDSVIALLAMDAEQRGLIPSGLDKSLWGSFMTMDDLYGKQWLLAYEARVKNLLPSVNGLDYIANNLTFDFLRSQNVEFYNSNRLVTYRPAATSGAGVIAIPFSIIG